MKTCATCRHWAKERPEHPANLNLRSCSHPKHSTGYGDGKNVPDDGMIVENDEGWAFETGPNFGCVNHDAKEGAG